MYALYLEEKRNYYTGFLSVTARDFMNHLLQRYDKITPSDLMHNKQKMDEPLDPSAPIDVYFKRIDECVQFITDAETAYIPEYILKTLYYAISSSNLYTDVCKEWRRKPKEGKPGLTSKHVLLLSIMSGKHRRNNSNETGISFRESSAQT